MTSESSTLKAYEYEYNFFSHVVFPFKIIKKWYDASWCCNSMASDPYNSNLRDIEINEKL